MQSLNSSVEIAMVRNTMRDLPQHALPEGFFIRPYLDGDEHAWVAIHDLADLYNKVTVETFFREFGGAMEVMRERGFFLAAPDGAIIGTATAWFDDCFQGAPAGRVHWVAIVPEFQGRGLSKPLMSAVMNSLAKTFDRACLTTSGMRIPAIRLYLNFGFTPCPRSESELQVWREVQQALGQKILND